MLIVAGLTLKNLKPRVWDAASSYYLRDLRAVMLSYQRLSPPSRAAPKSDGPSGYTAG